MAPPRSRASSALRELRRVADQDRAKFLARYFKTGTGEYAEGDVFLGIGVPVLRTLVDKFSDLPLRELDVLLKNEYHEARLLALLILVEKFKRADAKLRGEIFLFYLRRTRYVNNWDLVDASARDIIGEYLVDKNHAALDRLVQSKNVWERRIAIVATNAFISRGEFELTFSFARILRNDEHDLIHKAVGWMLREVGKHDETVLRGFLALEASGLPRTTLRYAIERFPIQERKHFLDIKRIAAKP